MFGMHFWRRYCVACYQRSRFVLMRASVGSFILEGNHSAPIFV